MKTWGKWLIGVSMLLPTIAGAQSFAETALLFSRTQPAGSARIMGMGGVQTSLGGDYSSALSNPAGLGMFNKSEFSISPGFNSASMSSNYLGNSVDDKKTNLHIPGFGLILQTEQDGGKGFLSGTFGVTYSRVNNFNKKFNYEGTNQYNSIIDNFIDNAYQINPNRFDYDYTPLYENEYNTLEGLAYNNYLIDGFQDQNGNWLYTSPLITFDNPSDIRRVFQNESIETTGAQNQWSFSYGANFSDKFFIGAGIGFTTLKYGVKKSYSESNFYFDLDPNYEPLDNLNLMEEVKINGTGINGTLGIIVRPVDQLQIGVSYTSPTSYKLTDTYNATMSTLWNDFDYFGDGSIILNNESEYTDEIISEYDLRTPSKLNVGASFFFEKYGFLSADIQVVNYSGAKYTSTVSGVDYNSENDQIKSLYQSTVNYRIGGEFRYQSFRARAGFSYMPDPFSTEQNGVSRQITSTSGGLGYRAKKFYLDVAVVFTQGQSSYRPYSVNSPDSPIVYLKNNTTFGMLTLGIPF